MRGVGQEFRLDMLILGCLLDIQMERHSNIHFVTSLSFLYIHLFFPFPSVNNQTLEWDWQIKLAKLETQILA